MRIIVSSDLATSARSTSGLLAPLRRAQSSRSRRTVVF